MLGRISYELKLEGYTCIQDRYTFDDRFIIGFNKYGQTYIPIQLSPCNNVYACYALERAKNIFNNANISVRDLLIIHGRDWNDTFKFSSNSLIQKINCNDYTKGYKSVDRWSTAFRVVEQGLD